MALKFFKQLLSGWAEVPPQQKIQRSSRKGMCKNFRIGKIKHVSQDRTHMLINVIEICNDEEGGMYEANYNLWIAFDKEWQHYVTKAMKGQYVVFGFYMQSFRNKDMSDSYVNVFKCRFINLIPTEQEARTLAVELSDSVLFVDHPYLKLTNVKF